MGRVVGRTRACSFEIPTVRCDEEVAGRRESAHASIGRKGYGVRTLRNSRAETRCRRSVEGLSRRQIRV